MDKYAQWSGAIRRENVEEFARNVSVGDELYARISSNSGYDISKKSEHDVKVIVEEKYRHFAKVSYPISANGRRGMLTMKWIDLFVVNRDSRYANMGNAYDDEAMVIEEDEELLSNGYIARKHVV